MNTTELSHVAFYTKSIDEMSRWYATVIDGQVVAAGATYAFISNDGEHHRVALVALPDAAPAQVENRVGFYHTAFKVPTLRTMKGLLGRINDAGIAPYRIANHVLTLSLYFRDPDGNSLELFNDLFDTVDDATAYMNTDTFDDNPAGRPLGFDELITVLSSGEDEAVLRAELREAR